MSEHFGSLALPVGEFLALEHGTEFDGYTIRSDRTSTDASEIEVRVMRLDGDVSPCTPQNSKGHKFAHERAARARSTAPGAEVGQALVVVPPDSTFRTILSTLVRNRIHRLYIVGGEGKALGLVTLTDVLRKVVEQ